VDHAKPSKPLRRPDRNRPCTATGFSGRRGQSRPPKGPAPPDDARPPRRDRPEGEGPPGGLVLKLKRAGAVRVGDTYLRILEIGQAYVSVWIWAPSGTQIVRAELDPHSVRWPAPRPKGPRCPGRREGHARRW
jgi:hypothetical protein